MLFEILFLKFYTNFLLINTSADSKYPEKLGKGYMECTLWRLMQENKDWHEQKEAHSK